MNWDQNLLDLTELTSQSILGIPLDSAGSGRSGFLYCNWCQIVQWLIRESGIGSSTACYQHTRPSQQGIFPYFDISQSFLSPLCPLLLSTYIGGSVSLSPSQHVIFLRPLPTSSDLLRSSDQSAVCTGAGTIWKMRPGLYENNFPHMEYQGTDHWWRVFQNILSCSVWLWRGVTGLTWLTTLWLSGSGAGTFWVTEFKILLKVSVLRMGSS